MHIYIIPGKIQFCLTMLMTMDVFSNASTAEDMLQGRVGSLRQHLPLVLHPSPPGCLFLVKFHTKVSGQLVAVCHHCEPEEGAE